MRERLTPKQTKVLASLLDGATITAAAKSAHAGVRTIYSWMHGGPFKAALVESQKTAIDAAVTRLTAMADKALNVLEGVLDDGETPAAVKVQAVTCAMGHLLRLHELSVLGSEVADMERELEVRGIGYANS